MKLETMNPEERTRLKVLDEIVWSKDVRAQIAPIVERVRAELVAKKEAVMTWESIPLTTFADALPAGIKSGWVFVLRAGANTGAERHPNSHQRMMSFEGTGDLQTERSEQTFNVQPAFARDGLRRGERPTSNVQRKRSEVGRQKSDLAVRWQSNVLVSEPDAPLEQRWVSIPQNVWHRPVIPNESDWVVVSFHTVPAEELIEERPGDVADGGTKQMVYLRKK